MKCRNCGYEIPYGELYCKKCGEEVRIVPDYNPLDDMLTAQIKVSINEDGEPVADERQYTRSAISSSRTGRVSKNHQTRPSVQEREMRKKEAMRRREKKRKLRRRLLLAMATTMIAVIVVSILIYMNSYTGIVRKGNKALASSEYAFAQEAFEKAIDKKPEQPEAYVGLSKIYIEKNDLKNAEKVFLDAIDKYPDNTAIHEACIVFYLDTKQVMNIPQLLKKSNNKIQEDLKNYIVEKPEFSLDETVVYDDVQQLTLTSSGKNIYYTMDGTDPDLTSSKYTEPIQLDEGETTIKAIAVNEEGVPGLYEEKIYTIELPIEEAPSVSPSTGQYRQHTKIEIKVPDGYTAYYTMDGTTPTTASKKYNGPISMPEGESLFKAILVNSSGRSSGVTTRNYILDIVDEE